MEDGEISPEGRGVAKTFRGRYRASSTSELNEIPKEVVRDAIAARFLPLEIALKCPMCQSEAWDVAGLVSSRIHDPVLDEREHTHSYPKAVIVCRRCCFSAEFSAKALGL